MEEIIRIIRQAVTLLVTQERYSVRRACGYIGLHPRTYRYEPSRSQDRHARFIERLEALSWKHPRYGYRRIRALLRGIISKMDNRKTDLS
jgi:putative transposase